MEFSIRVDASEARHASNWLGDAASARGIPAEPLWHLDLCMTEALANVVAHGGAGAGSSPVRLRLEVCRGTSGGEAAVTVTDGGSAFDPVAATPKARARTLGEAVPGGQGLTMLRKFADALEYSYAEGHNHLTIRVRWTGDGAPG